MKKESIEDVLSIFGSTRWAEEGPAMENRGFPGIDRFVTVVYIPA